MDTEWAGRSGGGGREKKRVNGVGAVVETFERRTVSERTHHLPGFQSMALSIGPDI